MYSNAGLIAIALNVKDCKQGRSKQAYRRKQPEKPDSSVIKQKQQGM
jgi:hypothetical protein